jgi:hypothetical protein
MEDLFNLALDKLGADDRAVFYAYVIGVLRSNATPAQIDLIEKELMLMIKKDGVK